MSELDWKSRAAMGHAGALARAAVGHSCVPLHLACDVCLGPLDDEESLYADQCSSCIEEAGGLSCLNATLRLDEPGWVARVSALREELRANGKGKGKNQWARAQAKEARAKSKADSLARAAATMAVHCTRTASACRSACGVCGEPLGIDTIYENGGAPSASRWEPTSADQCKFCRNAILARAPIDADEQVDQACPDAWAAHSNNPSGDAGALAGALKGVGSGKGYVFRFKGHGKGKFFGFKGAGSGKGAADFDDHEDYDQCGVVGKWTTRHDTAAEEKWADEVDDYIQAHRLSMYDYDDISAAMMEYDHYETSQKVSAQCQEQGQGQCP